MVSKEAFEKFVTEEISVKDLKRIASIISGFLATISVMAGALVVIRYLLAAILAALLVMLVGITGINAQMGVWFLATCVFDLIATALQGSAAKSFAETIEGKEK